MCFDFFCDSDDEPSIWTISKIEIIHKIRYHLKESTPTFFQIISEPRSLFYLADLGHLMTGFCFDSTTGVGDLDIDCKKSIGGGECDMKCILIKRKASVFNGVVDELVSHEGKTTPPGGVDVVFIKHVEHQVSDHF